MHKSHLEAAYEVLCSRTAKLLSLARQLPTDCWILKRVCLVVCEFMGQHGMVDEKIALLEDVHTSARMGLQILCFRYCFE
jgi:hypothetical protein